MRSGSVRDRLHGVVARVQQRFTAKRYAAIPRAVPVRSPAGFFGSATLFGARALRFPSADGQRTAAEREAALAKARRATYVARLWADPAVAWAV